jgi:hypothetical protein
MTVGSRRFRLDRAARSDPGRQACKHAYPARLGISCADLVVNGHRPDSDCLYGHLARNLMRTGSIFGTASSARLLYIRGARLVPLIPRRCVLCLAALRTCFSAARSGSMGGPAFRIKRGDRRARDQHRLLFRSSAKRFFSRCAALAVLHKAAGALISCAARVDAHAVPNGSAQGDGR